MTKCRSCHFENLNLLWKLEDGPYGDLFEENREDALDVNLQSLELGDCPNCGLLQLMEDPDIEQMHRNYLYRTALTVGLNDYYLDNLDFLVSKFNIKNMRALDIGCNDGEFMLALEEKGFEVLGVEPAIKSIGANPEKRLNIIPSFFDSNLAQEILDQYGKFGLITVNFVLANVNHLHDFLLGIKKLMQPDSVLAITSGYHPDQFSINMFDYISHDHISYFSLETLTKSLSEVDLVVCDSYRSELKGGSLHVVAKTSNHHSLSQASKRSHYVKQREDWVWNGNSQEIQELMGRVSIQKMILDYEIQDIEEPIAGIGASISTSYLINQFGLGSRISFLLDDDSSKWGKFSPLYGIPVLPFSNEKITEVRYAIILSWQHTNLLLNRLKANGFIGKVIVPLPHLRIFHME